MESELGTPLFDRSGWR
ncbi:hypothetical protein ACIHFD_33135 [Nonomuraea sp. NPDC051941]